MVLIPTPSPDPSTTAIFEATGNVRAANPWNASTMTWTEAHASTAEAWAGVTVVGKTDRGKRALILVAVGAAGSEQIVAGLNIGSTDNTLFNCFAPVAIAQGSRISVASTSLSTTVFMGNIIGHPVSSFSAAPLSFDILEFGPIKLTTSFGDWGRHASISAPSTPNTMSAWQDIDPGGDNRENNVIKPWALDHQYDHFAIWPYFDDSISSRSYFIFDVAVGAVGSEIPIMTGLPVEKNNASSNFECGPIWFPAHDIPVGSRISVRAQSSVADDQIGIRMYGLR